MLNQLEPWLQFLKRKDNVNLSITEAKQKYLKEQIEFDDFISHQRSTLQGKANKMELPPIDPIDPGYVGLERYRDYSNCTNKAIDLFPQNFGPEYVESIEYVDNQRKKINLTPASSLGRTNPHLIVKVVAYNPAYYNNQDYTVEVLPEWQGRLNVLKISIPPGLTRANLRIEIDLRVGDGFPERADLKNTHKFNMAMGLWTDGFKSNEVIQNNFHFSGGGISDMLIFLSTIGTNDVSFGDYVEWEGDQWNDNRTTDETIIQGPSPGNAFSYNFILLESETKPLDPNLYGPQFDWYFSDLNFRVCPI
jgi:hypothetical protein